MEAVFQSLSRNKYKISLTGLLVIATIISLVLARVDVWVSGTTEANSFVFNLGLAWIPFIAAAIAYVAMRSRVTFALVMPVSVVIWLIFFPNAPYLLTDFQHLADGSGYAPLWFDVILMIWFAWTGLLLGITSLYLMQEIVTRVSNAAYGWIFAVGATIMSSVGVYLGRFLRWNSWDLLKDPLPIAREVAGIVRHPIANLPSYIFTVLFTALFLFIYVTIHLFGRIIRERRTPLVSTDY